MKKRNIVFGMVLPAVAIALMGMGIRSGILLLLASGLIWIFLQPGPKPQTQTLEPWLERPIQK